MIRRCNYIGREGARCRVRADHRCSHVYDSSANWCIYCHDYRPAHGFERCGNCGGRHAPDDQSSPGLSLVWASDRTRFLRWRRGQLVQRAYALGVAG